MYQEKSKSKTNIFVKDCITKALFNLLEKKDFENITISEIIKKSGVSRMGFYRNYKTKENVIETFIQDKFFETINEIKDERKLNFQTPNIMLTTLKNFQKFSDYIKLFLNRNLEGLLYNCYHKAFYYLYHNDKQSRIREYSIQMFIGELFNLEITWLKKGMKETPEQLTKIYYRILKLRYNEQIKLK